ncbi:MAG: ABC transporter ATP-binding protein [Desulfobacterales bacterium]|nr:MAG: ABC transporter ATP-binding protein [Desulfobacterales bacterium]
MPLLQIQSLKTYFYTTDGVGKAVDDVNFDLEKGETLGLVGESGCGKSVTALSIMRLLKEPPAKIAGGRILFDGVDLLGLRPREIKAIRGQRVSMIFQEPMTSLNPVYTVGYQISETLMLHEDLGKKESWNRAVDMLAKVQIPSPEKRAHEYPHQLSGGMRQRAMIAMALACNPQMLIADEPTTALDVTVQAQIIDLMMQLKSEFGTAILLITHDLGVVAQTAERIVVMYTGKVVEEANTLSIFEDPKHPYTRGLLKSLPKMGLRSTSGRQPLHEIKGIVPSLYDLPQGCSFHPRCREAMAICRQSEPDLIDIGAGHKVQCHLYSPI